MKQVVQPNCLRQKYQQAEPGADDERDVLEDVNLRRDTAVLFQNIGVVLVCENIIAKVLNVRAVSWIPPQAVMPIYLAHLWSFVGLGICYRNWLVHLLKRLIRGSAPGQSVDVGTILSLSAPAPVTRCPRPR